VRLPGGAQSTLLLTDIVLPRPNGVAIAHELTERLGLDIPVVYMTGFTENGIVHRGILDPGQRLLQKPFTSDQLLNKLRAALDD
jgi:CheY-like chemotaxis protein